MDPRIILAIFLVLLARTFYETGRASAKVFVLHQLGVRPSFFPLAFHLMNTIFVAAVISKAINAIFG